MTTAQESSTVSRMLIATRAVLRGIRAGSAPADIEAIDRVSGIVILSEELAFDRWNELWVGFWEPGRDESALGL
jgi:hypothetical protein